MSLCFIHTADWHLGRVYRRLGPHAADSARWRFQAVRNIWALAEREKADFILVTGDVFETDTPRREVMRDVVELLREAPAPVYLLPGHSDPAAEGSVWHHPDFVGALEGMRHVYTLLQAEPLTLDLVPEAGEVVLFPCPVMSRRPSKNLTVWVPEGERGGQVRIGLAHGQMKVPSAADDAEKWNENAPNDNEDGIDSSWAERCGLDYGALGGEHAPTELDDPLAQARTFYPGTPECGGIEDVNPGHAFLVRLSEPGDRPHVERHFVGRAKTHDWGAITLRPGGGWDELAARFEGIEDKENVLLRAHLTGCLSETEMAGFEPWLNQARETLLAAHIEDGEIGVEPSDDEWAALRLEMSEAHILQMLGEPLDAATLEAVKDAELVAAWSEDEAARREARALFYQLLRG